MKQNPIAPWDRPPVSTLVQTLTGAGTVDLTKDTTYLDQTVGGPFDVVIPDGNYKAQNHGILIVSANEVSSVTFNITGNFVGADYLEMGTNAHTAMLQWDGAGWHLLGGNATKK